MNDLDADVFLKLRETAIATAAAVEDEIRRAIAEDDTFDAEAIVRRSPPCGTLGAPCDRLSSS